MEEMFEMVNEWRKMRQSEGLGEVVKLQCVTELDYNHAIVAFQRTEP